MYNTLKAFFFVLLPLTLTISCTPEPQGPWTDMFNGEDFSGWQQVGGEAIYTIEDGEIVGKTVLNTPNSFMVSDKQYGDFILEFEVKVDPKLNSGVQIRSHSKPDYRDGRFHGYQVEIDPSDRAWSGGIYEEARRGWIYPLDMNPEGTKAFKNGQWNKYRVEAVGNHIKTWVNDIPCANLWDEETAMGHFGLQVHTIYDNEDKEGIEVRWRNVRIITENLDQHTKETTAPEINRLKNELTEKQKDNGWNLLFDGKSTDGWRGAHKDSFPAFGWKIHDGILTVVESGGGEAEHGGDIVTVDEYSAFDLRLEFMLTDSANSGIKYFVTEQEAPSGSAHGLEFQILDDKGHPDAKKYTTFEGSRTVGSLYDLIPAKNKRVAGIGLWNQARVVVYPDNKVEHWLNGIKVLEYVRGSEEFRGKVAQSKYAADHYNEHGRFGEAEKGHILLQDHGDRVSFKSIKIKELK